MHHPVFVRLRSRVPVEVRDRVALVQASNVIVLVYAYPA
jgi:hypothetical protein